ncbi:MAG TPA: cytochrome P450 [Kineosporiaceae bacterium]|nr:cytochrome P450 [Kineosporiaceae bacterium]
MTGRELPVLGPDVDGGTRLGMTGRALFSDLRLVPGRMERIVAQADGVARLRGRLVPVAVVADPGLARTILTRPVGFGQGRGIDALALTFGQGLLTSKGDLHRRQRRLVQPAFHARRLAVYAEDAVRLATARSAAWRDASDVRIDHPVDHPVDHAIDHPIDHPGRVAVDVADEMSSLTLEFVGRTLFGTDVRDEVLVVSETMRHLLRIFPILMSPRGMLSARLPTPLRRRLRREIARLDAVVERVIAERGATGDTGDVVSMLLGVRDEDTGEGMPHRQVRDEVLTLLLAGHETTAVALSWAWYELWRTPAARTALDAELATGAAGAALADAAWDRLPVTRAIVSETLRLHPPAYIMGRRPTEDVTLGRYRFRRGQAVVISPYGLHRDPRSWGPDVAEFRPSRWLGPDGAFDEAAPGQPRGAYLPFGAGSRMCIGAGFAVMEAVLLLAGLARDWHVEFAPGFVPSPRPAVTYRPGPMPATLRPLPAITGPAPPPRGVSRG